MSNPNLFAELAKHEALKRDILAEYPDVDELTLHDTLQGAANLEETMIAVLRSARHDEGQVEAIGKQVEELRARASRFQARAEKARAMVRAAMEQSELKTLAAPDFTASLQRVQPKVVIYDEAVIPPDYFVTPAPKVSKSLIKKALDEGYSVAGAQLSNGGLTLTVRYR